MTCSKLALWEHNVPLPMPEMAKRGWLSSLPGKLGLLFSLSLWGCHPAVGGGRRHFYLLRGDFVRKGDKNDIKREPSVCVERSLGAGIKFCSAVK